MDPIAQSAIADIIVELFKEGVNGLKAAGRFVGEECKKHDVLGIAARRYYASMRERHNVVRIFGMSQPMPLDEIYTQANVLDKVAANTRLSVDDLHALYATRQSRFGRPIDIRPAIDVLNSLDRCVLLGKPGSGKTTFLKHSVLLALEGKLVRQRLPIFVSLKQLSDSTDTLFDFICRDFDTCGISEADPFVRQLLAAGKCLVLLDGLDEVTSNKRDTVIRQITELSEKYRANQFMVSCRGAAYNYWFDKFTDIEVADFGDEQIEVFIRNWFRESPPTGELCWVRLREQQSVKELASTPLLLTMLCLAFTETMDFSPNRAELFKDAIDALLKRWDVSRSIMRDDVYRTLTVKRKEDMFSVLAASTFQEEQYFFTAKRLLQDISAFIRHLPGSDEASAQVDSAAVLQAIEAQHGIIVQRAKDIYSFAHLCFQEFFAANYVVMAGAESQRNLIERYLTELRWRDVIVLVANLLPSADDFLILILRRMSKLGFSGKYVTRLMRQREAWGRARGNHDLKQGPGIFAAERSHLSVVEGTLPAVSAVRDFVILKRRQLGLWHETFLSLFFDNLADNYGFNDVAGHPKGRSALNLSAVADYLERHGTQAMEELMGVVMDWRSIEIEEPDLFEGVEPPLFDDHRGLDRWVRRHRREVENTLDTYEKKYPGRGVSVAMNRLKATIRDQETIATELAPLVEAVVAQEGDLVRADRTEFQHLKNHQSILKGINSIFIQRATNEFVLLCRAVDSEINAMVHELSHQPNTVNSNELKVLITARLANAYAATGNSMDDAVADVLDATMESSARIREAMSRRQIEETIMIAAAEVLVDILECPVYMRNETRATAIQTLLSMGSRMEPQVA